MGTIEEGASLDARVVDAVEEVVPARRDVPAGMVARNQLVLAGLLAVVVALTMAKQGGPVYDDPFILFRYARHLGDGTGWTFNPTGDSANAVTSVLVVAVLAGLGRIGVQIPAAAAGCFFVTTWGAAVLVAATLRRLRRPRAGVVAAVLVASSPALVSFWGMETSWVLVLLAALFYCGASRRPLWWSGALAGLLALARPDSIVLSALAIAAFHLVDPAGRRPVKEWIQAAAAAAVPVALWSAFALTSLGSVLPSTMAAKQAQGRSRAWPVFFSEAAVKSTARSMVGNGPVGTVFLLVLLALAAAGVYSVVVNRNGWQVVAPLAVNLVLIGIVYGLVLRIASYPWYYATTILAVLVVVAFGADEALGLLPAGVWRTAATVVLCAAFAATGFAQTLTGPDLIRARYPFMGDWISRHTPTDSRIAVLEIGALGWFGDREMVDYLGLLDPDRNNEVRRGDFTSWLAATQPDFWITTGEFVDTKLYRSSCISKHYALVYIDPPLSVYQRASAVPKGDDCRKRATKK